MGSAVKVVGRVARDVYVISQLSSRGRESAVGRSSDRRIQQSCRCCRRGGRLEEGSDVVLLCWIALIEAA